MEGGLTLTRASEPSSAAVGGLERIDQVEADLLDRHDHKLGQSLHGLKLERCGSAVPCGDHEWALVIGINKTHQIAKYDAMFVAQT